MTHYERIKQMTVEEFAESLAGKCVAECLCEDYASDCADCPCKAELHCSYHLVKNWLESEVDE